MHPNKHDVTLSIAKPANVKIYMGILYYIMYVPIIAMGDAIWETAKMLGCG